MCTSLVLGRRRPQSSLNSWSWMPCSSSSSSNVNSFLIKALVAKINYTIHSQSENNKMSAPNWLRSTVRPSSSLSPRTAPCRYCSPGHRCSAQDKSHADGHTTLLGDLFCSNTHYSSPLGAGQNNSTSTLRCHSPFL